MISLKYKSYWHFSEKMKSRGRLGESLRLNYLERWCSYIGKDARFAGNPIMPHGFHGVHISNGATFGKNVVIFQNVTIGSNTLKDSKRRGAPKIGDNVFIGAGASIIGNVTIGSNCRIGANCVVVKDMPANTVAVLGDIRFINRAEELENTFIDWKDV